MQRLKSTSSAKKRVAAALTTVLIFSPLTVSAKTSAAKSTKSTSSTKSTEKNVPQTSDVVIQPVTEDLGLEDSVINKAPKDGERENPNPLDTTDGVIEEDIPDSKSQADKASTNSSISDNKNELDKPDLKSTEDQSNLETEQSQQLANNSPEDTSLCTENPAEQKPDVRNGYTHVDINMEGMDKALTQKYINYYQGKEGREILVFALKNSVAYRPYVIESLKKNNLPAYLQYIPIVESNYRPTAVSRSGATGIWQFMENSMAPLMKKSKWFDDRRDPWLSTDAAMLKFKDNYRYFNDWSLAIAAYNCGAGAMLRLVKANPGADYWTLAEKGLLKAEPTHYIPKLIAITEIVENAGYYGLEDVRAAAALIDGKEVEEFDYVQTKAMISIKQLSQATGLPMDRIKRLNMALLKECTPLGETYKLRLPKGYSKGLSDKLKNMGLATDCQLHTVEKGETLWAISRKYEVTVSDLCLANGINENSVLSIGKQLVVPIFK